MSEERVFTVSDSFRGARIDKVLSEEFSDISRAAAAKLIADGKILVNGIVPSKSLKLSGGEEITANIPEPAVLEVRAENIPLEIVYEDDELLVVNKPKGMVVHPAAGNYEHTLVNALMYHCKDRLSSINGVIRPGIVHRIDKDTSGLLIVAKNDFSHVKLSEQIKAHSFTREYEAVVCGHLKEDEGTVNAPIGRSAADRKKMCVTDKNSREAVTHYSVIKEYSSYTHVKLRLETGRTHQIRVHMSYIGHPVLGDAVYGKTFKGIDGQCLHAKKIGFIHPKTEKYLEFDSELPEYFMNILRKL